MHLLSQKGRLFYFKQLYCSLNYRNFYIMPQVSIIIFFGKLSILNIFYSISFIYIKIFIKNLNSFQTFFFRYFFFIFLRFFFLIECDFIILQESLNMQIYLNSFTINNDKDDPKELVPTFININTCFCLIFFKFLNLI